MIDELRDSLTQLDLPERPRLAAIVDRGRAARRRRIGSELAGLGVTAAVAAVAVGLVLSGPGTAPGNARPSAGGAQPRTIRTAAFTLVSYTNGKARLTLTNSQVFDPRALRAALAKDGIPAIVKTNVYCFSSPAAPDPDSTGVMSMRPRLGTPAGLAPAKALLRLYGRHTPHPDLKALIDHTETVIDPAKLPSGTELAFDYAPGRHLLAVDLVYTASHVCRSGSQPGQ